MSKKEKDNTAKIALALLIGFVVVKSISGSKNTSKVDSAYYDINDLQVSDTATAEGMSEQFETPDPQHLANANYFIKHLLDPLTKHAGLKLPIDSWLRIKELNESVGGAPDSFHLTAEAIDTKTAKDYGVFIKALLQARLPFTELILYGSKTKPTRIHLALVKGRGAEQEILFKKPSGGYEELSKTWLKNTFL